jgi:trehalose 6-phosphate phosphatase
MERAGAGFDSESAGVSPQQEGALARRRVRRPSLLPVRKPRYAFAAWNEIREHIRAADFRAILLDFDGTLVNFRPRPDDVRLSARAKRVIRLLVRHGDTFVGIVSGRKLDDLRKLIAVEGLRYAGLHGAEAEGEPVALGRKTSRSMIRLRKLLQRRLEDFPKVWIEDKGLTFAVHYRGASAAVVKAAHGALLSAVASAGAKLRVLDGNRVWEILPSEVPGKSVAVQRILAKLPAGIPVLYVGDDGTDEMAFAALAKEITIRVGRNYRTQAKYYLNSPAEVVRFLERLERALD